MIYKGSFSFLNYRQGINSSILFDFCMCAACMYVCIWVCVWICALCMWCTHIHTICRASSSTTLHPAALRQVLLLDRELALLVRLTEQWALRTTKTVFSYFFLFLHTCSLGDFDSTCHLRKPHMPWPGESILALKIYLAILSCTNLKD